MDNFDLRKYLAEGRLFEQEYPELIKFLNANVEDLKQHMRDEFLDVEDEIDIDDEEIESDIEVKTSVPGESADEDAVLGLLTKAQEEAEKLGDEKLLDQIGNTITFFTRKHIVRSGE